MDRNAFNTVIGYFTYFWMFQLAAFGVMYFMGMVTKDTSMKAIIVLFIIFGLAYTGFYMIKRSGDRKRAARQANAQYEVRGGQIAKKKKKKKR